MAAFALGLIGDPSAKEPLVAALADPQPLVKGSAAEGLGLIGDAGAADAIVRMASQIVQSGALTPPPAEDADSQRDTPAAAFRLAIYALVRLKAYAPLASVVLEADGQPRIRWWPVAFALQRLEDARALPALLALVRDPQPYTRGFAARGLGSLKNPSAVPVLVPLVTGPDRMVAVEAIRALARLGDGRAAPPLLALIQNAKADPYLRLEAVTAAASISGPRHCVRSRSGIPRASSRCCRDSILIPTGGCGAHWRQCSAPCRRNQGCLVFMRCSMMPISGSSRRCSGRSFVCVRRTPPPSCWHG
jgi:HEAT repeat protein